jgi:hypothetical protein
MQSYPLTDGLGDAVMPVHVGQNMLMLQKHVSPDADAPLPMPAFSTLAEPVRYRAQLDIARAMEDAAILMAVNDRIAVPKLKPSAWTSSCRTLLAMEARRQHRIHRTALTSLEIRKDESPSDFVLAR